MMAFAKDCPSFDDDLGAWDVGSVTTLRRAFLNAESFRGPKPPRMEHGPAQQPTERFSGVPTRFNTDLSAWDVRRVTDFRGAFQDAAAFRQDLCAWGVGLNGSSAIDARDMFAGTACPNTSDPRPLGGRSLLFRLSIKTKECKVRVWDRA